MNFRSLILPVFLLSFISCSITKYVPDNEYLLNTVKIKSDIPALGEEQLKPYLRQIPNQGIFGKYRLSLKIYSLSGRDTTKWRNRTLRKMGEAPVIFNNDMTETTRLQMEKFLSNKGYVNADVTVDVALGKKKANLRYSVQGNKPYRIHNFDYSINNDSIGVYILKDTLNSMVKENNLFDTDVLDKERQRITTQLRTEGFYYFNKDYLHYEADSTLQNNQVDVTLKAFVADSLSLGDKKSPYRRMKIGNVSFVPWYSTDKRLREQISDTVEYLGYRFFYDSAKEKLRPSLLVGKTYIVPGSYYNEKDVEKTYAALNSLGTTKYVSIVFREQENGEYLDCLILLSPNKLQNFTVSLEGTNTEGDIGAAVSGTYQHRNLFNGAEQLNIKQRVAYQPMGDISNLLSDSSLEYSGEVSISFPQFFFPFIPREFKLRTKASTELLTSFNYQTNPWYVRTIFGAGMKYNWLTGPSNNKRYTFDLININYVYLPEISEEYKEKYINTSSITKYSYEDHLIISTGFSFAKTTKKAVETPYNYRNYRTSIETAGNLLTALNNLFKAPKDSGYYTIADIQYAQYAKGEFDFSQYVVMNKRNTIVYHAGFGLAYPYGNADVVPYEKRFYSGGANSVRGWSVRTLGPGTYKSTASGDDTDLMQAGDIRLDLNVEYRFKLFWLLEGALFADAGNIWTIRDYDSQPGGLFKFDSFYKEIALSYGAGLRLDFSFFVLRVDGGIKLYDPAQDATDRWRKRITSNDYAFHIAIGYPF